MLKTETITIRHGECNHIKIYRYPDGQKNVKIDFDYFNDVKTTIEIKCSIIYFEELEVLLAIVAAFRKADFFISKIHFAYLFGMRSDRAFESGMPNYFKEVVAPIINYLNIPEVSFLDPHSKLSLCSINNSISHTFNFSEGFSFPKFIIFADESATRIGMHFYCEITDEITDNCIYFIKNRMGQEVEVDLSSDNRRRIENTINNPFSKETPIVIRDDLCDAGETFIAISKYLKQHFPGHPLHLAVTHGLFTKGINHVADHYDMIFTTNSYKDFPSNPTHPKLIVKKVI